MSRALRAPGWIPLVLAAAAAWTGAAAAAADTVRLGILQQRTLEEEQARWQPLVAALAVRLPDLAVQTRLLDEDGIAQAVEDAELDLVLTHPGQYVALAHDEGVSTPLATLVRRARGAELLAYGSTVLVPAESPVLDWPDLAGRRLATVDRRDFGGFALPLYQLQLWEVPVGALSVLETGPPETRLLEALRAGRADAILVRAGEYEHWIASGRIRPERLRVLDPQDLPDYPLAVSTPLYPEWPVAALRHVGETRRQRLTLALLALRGAPELAQGELAGFAPAQNYEPIEEVLRTLRAPPFRVPELSWAEAARQQAVPLALATLVLALLAGLSLLLERQRRRLRAALAERSALADELAVAAQAFRVEEGIVICDLDGRIVRVNDAFTTITGYTREEALGHTPGELLRSGRQDEAFYRAMWAALTGPGHWKGELWNRRKNGEEYPEWLSITRVADAQGRPRWYVAIFQDLSWRRKAEAQIEHLAFHDPLTGLGNRRLLLELLGKALHRARRDRRWGSALFLDLDRFKAINDAWGHAAGDAALTEVARRIVGALREDDLAGRLGGDEFLVVLPPRYASRELAADGARTVAERLLRGLNLPIHAGAQTHHLGVSIGIALFGPGEIAVEAAELLKNADLAMYTVKQQGRNGIAFFDPEMETRARMRHLLQGDLARAIEKGEMCLYLQPQVDRDGRIVGAEVLLRWVREQGEVMPAGAFIALAEETGLILPLGDWVLRRSCALLRQWQEQPPLAGLRLAVNVSARQFRSPDFVTRIAEMLRTEGAPAGRLELEITESVFLEDLQLARSMLGELETLGVSLALDDFGTGYSSLAYLAELPFDVIKIDQRFVARIGRHTRQDEAVITTIIALGRHLGMQVLAEGVEREDQASYLIRQGCDLLQGFRFGRPMPVGDFEALLRNTAEA